jgi:hypothetical protein
MAADGHTKRRILLRSMRYSLRAQSAPLVRGSSRRIMTLRFRPAYIRVINRRYLSTAATCFAFPNKTVWISLCQGRSRPEEQPIQNLSNQEFYPWLDKSLHIRTPRHHRFGCVCFSEGTRTRRTYDTGGLAVTLPSSPRRHRHRPCQPASVPAHVRLRHDPGRCQFTGAHAAYGTLADSDHPGLYPTDSA